MAANFQSLRTQTSEFLSNFYEIYIQVFKRLVATSRAPQIMVLSMLRSFGKIGPQIDQIWAWLSRGHRWSPGVRNPLKSSVTGPSLLVNCYLEIKFHKIIRVNPPPPPLIREHRRFIISVI